MKNSDELVESVLSHVVGICVITCVQLLVILDPIGVPQGEDQVRELAPLEFCDKPFVLFVGELAGVVFKDGLGCFAGGCIKEHDRCHVLAKRLGDAGDLLGQDPH